MQGTYLSTLAIILCMATSLSLSTARHFRPYIISGWPIMIGDEDQAAVPDDIYVSKMSDPALNGFHPGWGIYQNRFRNN